MAGPGIVGPRVEAALRDLEDRTLSHLRGDICKLVYLSATRDYNTGEYQHEGLAQRFGREAAQSALARAHDAVFDAVLERSLRDMADALEAYVESTGAERERVLQSWRELEAYRVLIPKSRDPLSVEFFISNVRVALEALALDSEKSLAHSPV